MVIKPKPLNCPNCGGPVELRGFAHTLNVVCPQCLSVLDTSTPEVQVLQTFQSQTRIQPLIPLGTRATFSGTSFEAIGFQVREVEDEDGAYAWREYLLFNPYKGFRYLSEYNGHWNYIRVLNTLPEASGRSAAYQGRSYKLFDSSTAKTFYVLGEFPWQVRVGETVQVSDFVAPPLALSAENTGNEVTWSQGEYWTGKQIWEAFRLPGTPPSASGIFMNQPSPHIGKPTSAWRTFLWLAAALGVILILFTLIAQNREVFRQRYTVTAGAASAAPIVTPEFSAAGRPNNLQITTSTDLTNNWAYFSYALVNKSTGQARNFGREISRYGSSNSPNDRVVIPDVPPGQYYLRIEPEVQSGSFSYDVSVRRGVPTYGWFILAAVLLLIPPLGASLAAAGFERNRWRESSHA